VRGYDEVPGWVVFLILVAAVGVLAVAAYLAGSP